MEQVQKKRTAAMNKTTKSFGLLRLEHMAEYQEKSYILSSIHQGK